MTNGMCRCYGNYPRKQNVFVFADRVKANTVND